MGDELSIEQGATSLVTLRSSLVHFGIHSWIWFRANPQRISNCECKHHSREVYIYILFTHHNARRQLNEDGNCAFVFCVILQRPEDFIHHCWHQAGIWAIWISHALPHRCVPPPWPNEHLVYTSKIPDANLRQVTLCVSCVFFAT